MKCDYKKRRRCAGLQLAVTSGTVEVPFVVTTRGKAVPFNHGVRVKFEGRKTILFFNHCPFCGAALRAPEKAKKEKPC